MEHELIVSVYELVWKKTWCVHVLVFNMDCWLVGIECT